MAANGSIVTIRNLSKFYQQRKINVTLPVIAALKAV